MIRKMFNEEDFKNATRGTHLAKPFLQMGNGFGSWEAHDSPDVNVLRPSFYWEGMDENVMTRLSVSPWRYVSSHPIHNPGGFDWWVEVEVGDANFVVGNCKETE